MKIWSKIKKGTNLKNYDPYQKFSNKILLKKLKKMILENYKSLNNNVIKSNYFIS